MIRNHAAGFGTNQQFRVEIRDWSNAVLAVAYASRPGDPLLGNWSMQHYDLSAFRGASIRIAFAGVLAGFLAVSLFPAYRVGLLHLTLVGGFAVITFVVALVIGAICVRLKEIYFAFVTLAFQMLIHSTILSWVSLTGGDQGLRGGIPRPPFLGIDLSNHLHLYIASCALLVIGLFLMHQIAQSPFGYTLRMIRDNAGRASFIGIDVWRAKLTIFVLAALFASIGGIIMSLFVSGAYPEFAYWTISGEGIFINMLGGVSTFLGPMVGTLLLLILNDTVTRLTEYYGIVLGVVILFFAIGLRKGLMDFAIEWYEQRPDGAKERAK
jgi:branched-chain amino acid transport system permease protein